MGWTTGVQEKFWLWWSNLMEAKERGAGREHNSLVVSILWQIWKSRNRTQFNREEACQGRTVLKVVNEWNEYDSAQQTDKEVKIEEREQ